MCETKIYLVENYVVNLHFQFIVQTLLECYFVENYVSISHFQFTLQTSWILVCTCKNHNFQTVPFDNSLSNSARSTSLLLHVSLIWKFFIKKFQVPHPWYLHVDMVFRYIKSWYDSVDCLLNLVKELLHAWC
jgi:hypothetical protein